MDCCSKAGREGWRYFRLLDNLCKMVVKNVQRTRKLGGGVSLAHPEEAKADVAKGIKLIPSCG